MSWGPPKPKLIEAPKAAPAGGGWGPPKASAKEPEPSSMAANGKHYFHNGKLVTPPKPKAPDAKAPEPKVAKLGDTSGYPDKPAVPAGNPLLFGAAAPAATVSQSIPAMESWGPSPAAASANPLIFQPAANPLIFTPAVNPLIFSGKPVEASWGPPPAAKPKVPDLPKKGGWG